VCVCVCVCVCVAPQGFGDKGRLKSELFCPECRQFSLSHTHTHTYTQCKSMCFCFSPVL